MGSWCIVYCKLESAYPLCWCPPTKPFFPNLCCILKGRASQPQQQLTQTTPSSSGFMVHMAHSISCMQTPTLAHLQLGITIVSMIAKVA